jgi:hypothetical protein
MVNEHITRMLGDICLLEVIFVLPNIYAKWVSAINKCAIEKLIKIV